MVKLQDGAYMETQEVEDEHSNSNIPMLLEEDKEDKTLSAKSLKNVTQKEMLNDLRREVEQRKLNIEGKLLELYGLKQKKSYMAKLQRDLDEKMAKISTLRSVTIASLQAEKTNLKEEIKRGVMATKKLEFAKKMIVDMERNIDGNTEHIKGHVSRIEEIVCRFRGFDDENSERDDEIEKKLESFRNVELEVGMIRRRNKRLELEKRELKLKLVDAQERITSLSHMTEGKVMLKLEDEIRTLNYDNEELSREIERLQKNRFEMVEELVYQRWLNGCLKFEKEIDANTPRNISKPNSENKTFMESHEKNNPPSSYPSSSFSFSSSTSSTESDRVDSTTMGNSSSSSQSSSRNSFSFMKRITKWGCKDDSVVTSLAERRTNPKSKNGLVRRFSDSMVRDQNSSTTRNKGHTRVMKTSPFENKENGLARSSEMRRVRRVSFSDLVMTHDDMPSSIHQRELDFPERSDEKTNASVVSGEDSVENSRLEDIDETDHVKNASDSSLKENKGEDQIMQHLFNVLFLFVFFFLAYFLYTKSRSYKTCV